MKKNNRKYFVYGVIFILMVLGVIVIFKNNKIKIKEFANDYYSVKYDSTWKIKEHLDNEIKFIHKDTNSLIDISISDLDSNLYGKTLEQISENIVDKIESENQGYKCISKNEKELNNNIGKVQELLFENGKKQSLVLVGMHGYKVFISNFSADNKYFDILLDSSQNINNNYNFIDKAITLNEELNIETTGLNFNNDDVDYSDVDEYEKYYSNYYIKCKIPKQFVKKFSPYGAIYFEEKDNHTSITIKCENSNIIDLINNAEEKLKKDNNYEIDKISDGQYEGYCLKTNNGNSSYVEIYYVIDNDNTIKISISGNITKNLIDNIKIIEAKKSGGNIDRNVVNGNLEGTLSYDEILSISNHKYANVTVNYKIPEKYTEVNSGYYMSKFDAINFDSQKAFVSGNLKNDSIPEKEGYSILDFYDYNVLIYISNIKLKDATLKGDVTFNGVTYQYYTSEYNAMGLTIKKAFLERKIDIKDGNELYYRIRVDSLNDIPQSVLQDFTSVSIEVKSLE